MMSSELAVSELAVSDKKVACSPFLIYNQTLQSAESPVFGLFLLL